MQDRREPEHRRRKQLLFNESRRRAAAFGSVDARRVARPPTGGSSAAIRVVDGATSVPWSALGSQCGKQARRVIPNKTDLPTLTVVRGSSERISGLDWRADSRPPDARKNNALLRCGAQRSSSQGTPAGWPIPAAGGTGSRPRQVSTFQLWALRVTVRERREPTTLGVAGAPSDHHK